MKRYLTILALLACLVCLSGCDRIDPDALVQQVETIAQQIDVEGMVSSLIERIDWEELKSYVQKGYDALTEKYPALKQENITAFLKDNGLKLMNKLVSGSDEAGQENAKKLGEIIKILYPDLSDEVNSIFVK